MNELNIKFSQQSPLKNQTKLKILINQLYN